MVGTYSFICFSENFRGKVQIKGERRIKIQIHSSDNNYYHHIKKGDNNFFIEDDGSVKAEIHYVPMGNKQLLVDKTQVSEELKGEGVGQELVKKMVDFARQEGKMVMATCPFAKKELENHAEYHDVLTSGV
ncbi:GNAT family N-acetyltransferase [Aneurinibacillus sp. Ricciae_BoGa-3]|uniref:GNAT family N-acetyltransferase n=1 Tax=Aneurinibacillus sp. Ricciae_BoGa-3 TaxID=3022697 RepID=UPI0023420435|nr:GNAT family N-acetyltransferase [Aneurinibacillus sp. Ricciae_BoGa-3]WCK53287.1 GNAT family N-acetyltransferase [Aneurinibacillus sp. Ricciae_BoGa-3]